MAISTQPVSGTIASADLTLSTPITLSPSVPVSEAWVDLSVRAPGGGNDLRKLTVTPVFGGITDVGGVDHYTTLDFQRGGTTMDTALTVEGQVVWGSEFNGVQVITGSYPDTDPDPKTVPITAVNPAETFVMVFVRGGQPSIGRNSIRAHLSSSTELTLKRGSLSSTLTYTIFVIPWAGSTINNYLISMNGVQEANQAITAVDLSKTFCMWSFTSSYVGLSPDDSFIECRLTSTTNFRAFRNGPTGNVLISLDVISHPDLAVQQSASQEITGTSGAFSFTAVNDPLKTLLARGCQFGNAWNTESLGALHVGLATHKLDSVTGATVERGSLDDELWATVQVVEFLSGPSPAVISREPADIVAEEQLDTWAHVRIDTVDETAGNTHALYGSETDHGDDVAVWETRNRLDTGGVVANDRVAWAGLTPNTPYYFVVVSTDGSGNKTLSNVLEITTAYARPTNPVVEDTGPESVTVSWTDQSGGLASHQVFYRESVDPEPIFVGVIPVGGTLEYNFVDLTPGTEYVFEALAWDGDERLSGLTGITASTEVAGQFTEDLSEGVEVGEDLETYTVTGQDPEAIVLGDSASHAELGDVSDGVELGENLETSTLIKEGPPESILLGDSAVVSEDHRSVSDGVELGDDSDAEQTAFREETDGVRMGDSTEYDDPVVDPARSVSDGGVFGDVVDAVAAGDVSEYFISPDAVKGAYLWKDTTDAPWEINVTGHFSRLDLYAGVGTDGTTNGGIIEFTVEVWNGSTWEPYTSGEVSTYRELVGNETENLTFFYDSVLKTDGTNASVFTLFHLPFDRYRVILSAGGLDPADPGADASYRVNGIGVYTLDPMANMFPAEFATDTNVFSMLPESGHEDLRNHVIVVGSRKGVVTDSAKFSGEQTNPNNLEPEFHVEVASDPNSIYNPNAANFTGNRRVAVIYDEKVSDSDFARWLALTALFRYRSPKHKVPVETVGVPMLELGDSIQVYEARHQMVNRVVWVQGVSETWTSEEATSNITTSSYPEIPAYQPREDLDINALFGGQPAINVNIGYTNIFGTALTNTDLDAPDIRNVASASEVMTSTISQKLSAVALPETIVLQGISSDLTAMKTLALVNHPYRHFWNISAWDANHLPTLDFDIQEGDGAVGGPGGGTYNTTYYKMPSTAPMTWNIKYNTFFSRTTENPFYDPYSSELGHLVSVNFDALISGRYRVSVWDARTSGGIETPVAWLTNPTNDPMDAAAHWTYMEPQSNVEFLWDGVDNIGIWNRLHSSRYAQRVAGSFGQEAVAAGEGFYVWNDTSTNKLTQIGDDVPENYRTGGDIREAGYPFFTSGNYSQFYVKIEVWNDDLVADNLTADNRTPEPIRVETNSLPIAYNDTEEAYIWTHLGEPNQIDISIEEWNADKLGPSNPGEYSQGSQADGWETLGASDPATLRNGKPVRISFNPRPRPGVLFGENSGYTSARLTRQVHLQTTVFDQFWTFFNTPWDGIHHGNVAANQKRLTSRMFHNNEHTLEWADTGFRTGAEISAYKWVFEPRMFKKDFGKGYEEPIEYGDYEQLEALPGYQERRLGGANREEEAFINLAFMNYLFYFSAHSLDRSGRRQWMLNREFIDKSKIVTPDWLAATYDTNPEYAVNHEDKGADLYLKRTIFTREWLDPHWESGGARTPLSPANAEHPGTGGITDAFEQQWLQFPVSSLDLESADLTQNGVLEHEDLNLEAYITDGTAVNREIRKNNGQDDADRTRRTLTDVSNHYVLPGQFNQWDFIRGTQNFEWYPPSPKVDFHPYWTQTMPNWMVPHTNYYIANDPTANFLNGKLPAFSGTQATRLSYAGLLMCPSSHIVEKMRDPKGQENWFGYGFDTSVGSADNRGIRLEQSVGGWAADEVRPNITSAFDYVRQDQLNRYEHFRGMWGRGPYEYRDDTYANYGNDSQPRYGPRQNVKPSGVYLMNLARYTDFTTAPAHSMHRQDYQHYTRGISDWYYIRFRHEYVWYHDRHFPVSGKGTSMYELFRQEYTTPGDTVVNGWYLVSASPSVAKTYYDAGAWVGWKDDIPRVGPTKWVNGWDTDPVLRWGDAAYRGTGTYVQGDLVPWDNNSGRLGTEYSSGGYNYSANSWQNTSYEDLALNPEPHDLPRYIRRNIFDHSTGHYGLFTLAVGPELDVSREISMNLVLPTNLSA